MFILYRISRDGNLQYRLVYQFQNIFLSQTYTFKNYIIWNCFNKYLLIIDYIAYCDYTCKKTPSLLNKFYFVLIIKASETKGKGVIAIGVFSEK